MLQSVVKHTRRDVIDAVIDKQSTDEWIELTEQRAEANLRERAYSIQSYSQIIEDYESYSWGPATYDPMKRAQAAFDPDDGVEDALRQAALDTVIRVTLEQLRCLGLNN